MRKHALVKDLESALLVNLSQMNMYMGYFAKEELEPGDNPPIGIILSREKDELMVEYATYGMDQNLFVSKYELYLPDKDQLRALIAETLSKQTNDYIRLYSELSR